MPEEVASPLEDWTDSPISQGNRLYIKRDDLLPFPLAGNKVRKLNAELADIDVASTLLVTVGAITSNHCRTTAMLAAQRGGRAHLLLHGNETLPSAQLSLRILEQLGATWAIVNPSELATEIDSYLEQAVCDVHFIAGGCHTAAGVQAYSRAVHELSTQLTAPPDLILVASGTGATQAGIIAGCRTIGWDDTQVLGVSVARTMDRGLNAVQEALHWVHPLTEEIRFTDRYRAGGYGQYDEKTLRAVAEAWRCGLPADTTYTGKALSAWLDIRDSRLVPGTTIYWHTGGLATHLYSQIDYASAPPRPESLIDEAAEGRLGEHHRDS